MQTFAKALSREDNEALLLQALSGDDDAREKFFKHNMRLAGHIVMKYRNTKHSEDDLFSCAMFGMYKAFNTYNQDKNIKFATYASTCMHNEIKMYLRNYSKSAAKRNTIVVSIDDPLATDLDGNQLTLSDVIVGEDGRDFMTEEIEMSNLRSIIEEYKKQTSPRDYSILMKRMNDVKQRDLAKEFNISQSYIARIEARELKRLKKIASQLNKQCESQEQSAYAKYKEEKKNMNTKKWRPAWKDQAAWLVENTQLTTGVMAKIIGVSYNSMYQFVNALKRGEIPVNPDPSARELFDEYIKNDLNSASMRKRPKMKVDAERAESTQNDSSTQEDTNRQQKSETSAETHTEAPATQKNDLDHILDLIRNVDGVRIIQYEKLINDCNVKIEIERVKKEDNKYEINAGIYPC